MELPVPGTYVDSTIVGYCRGGGYDTVPRLVCPSKRPLLVNGVELAIPVPNVNGAIRAHGRGGQDFSAHPEFPFLLHVRPNGKEDLITAAKVNGPVLGNGRGGKDGALGRVEPFGVAVRPYGVEVPVHTTHVHGTIPPHGWGRYNVVFRGVTPFNVGLLGPQKGAPARMLGIVLEEGVWVLYRLCPQHPLRTIQATEKKGQQVENPPYLGRAVSSNPPQAGCPIPLTAHFINKPCYRYRPPARKKAGKQVPYRYGTR